MHFDPEGHILIPPSEFQGLLLSDASRLITSVLLPGTPMAIPTHEQHYELLEHFAKKFGLHPNCLFFKGSTKIGFSIAPKATKVWMKFGDESDLDLAIVDQGLFSTLDNEVGQWERDPNNRGRMFGNPRLLDEYKSRAKYKGMFDCFSYHKLPDVRCMRELNACIESAPVEECCGLRRPLSAFVYRDWWGVHKKYDFDLYCLRNGLLSKDDPFPTGEGEPRPRQELVTGVIDNELMTSYIEERNSRIEKLEAAGAVWDNQGQFYSLDGRAYDASGNEL
ncbi:MAG: hypothetical protein ACJ8C4_15560 [Gemmataceae bacterium]